MAFFEEIHNYNDKIAVIEDTGRKTTYRELAVLAHRIASVVESRTLVLVLMENKRAAIAGYVGFLANNIVPMIIDGNTEETFVKDMIQKYAVPYLYLPKKIAGKYSYEKVFEKEEYCVLKTEYPSTIELYEELALLMSTSGSTGSPKFVRQSYKNIKENTKSIIEYLNIDGVQRAVTILPLYYTFGLSVINTHFAKGATVLLTDKTLFEKELWDFMSEYQVTSVSGVPYTFEMLKKLRFFRMDLPSLQMITQAGGRLSPLLQKEFGEYAAKKGIRFFVMYGQTEATARMSYLPSEYSTEKLGSIGIAIPGGSFFIKDENGTIIDEIDQEGELYYQGDNVSLGYAYGKDDLKKGNENGYVINTGDIAKRDKDGFYYITGRKKRFLKMFSKRINLDEVEYIIERKFPECRAACCGTDDEMQVYIQGKTDTQMVLEYICVILKIPQKTVSVTQIPEIPRNESGKVLYSVLNQC